MKTRKTQETQKTVVALLAVALCVSLLPVAAVPASAAIVASEPFDYIVGVHGAEPSPVYWQNKMGTGSGFGFGNEWYDHAGGAYRFGIATGGHTGTFADSTGLINLTTPRERGLSPVRSGSAGMVTWQYLTMSITTAGQLGGIRTYNGNGYYVSGVHVEADGTYSLSGQGGSAASGIAASTDATSPDVLVVKQDSLAGNFYDLSMWVNPTSLTEAGLGAPDLQATGLKPGYGKPDYAKIQWRAGTSQVDNFMLADSYADLPVTAGDAGDIPEPATMGMLALALAGAGGYVRRRKRS